MRFKFSASREQQLAPVGLLFGAIVAGLAIGEIAYYLETGRYIRRLGLPVWFDAMFVVLGVGVAMGGRNPWFRSASGVFALQHLLFILMPARYAGEVSWPWHTCLALLFGAFLFLGCREGQTRRFAMIAATLALLAVPLRYASLRHLETSVFDRQRRSAVLKWLLGYSAPHFRLQELDDRPTSGCARRPREA